MRGSLRQLFISLQEENAKLQAELKKEKQRRIFLSTNLFDAKYTIKQMKLYIKKNHKLNWWQKLAIIGKLHNIAAARKGR